MMNARFLHFTIDFSLPMSETATSASPTLLAARLIPFLRGTTIKKRWRLQTGLSREEFWTSAELLICGQIGWCLIGNFSIVSIRKLSKTWCAITELTFGIFAVIGNDGPVYRLGAVRADGIPPTITKETGVLSECWKCGGSDVCAMGKHLDIAAQFCSERTANPDRPIVNKTALTDPDVFVRTAAKIVELTVDAYGETAKDVGGPVDVATLRKGGSVYWNAIKDNCSKNQE